MTDIVERLREQINPDHPNLWKVGQDRVRAADEIELLRSRLAYLEERWQKLRELMDE